LEPVDLSFKPRHLARYRDVAALLIRQRELVAGLSSDPLAVGAADETNDVEAAEELASSLETMGPTFVKLGQLLSTRSDLLPPAHLEALSRLQDQVEPFSFADVEEIVTAELGVRMSDGFQWFDSTPMAAASLGQVHRAMLRSGRSVAVKVQRPGIRDQILEDMDVIAELAAFVDERTQIGRDLGFAPMVAEFRRALLGELDYQQEAANLVRLGENLAGYSRLVVPAPVLDYTTSLVLTMDLVPGRNVAGLGPLAQLEVDGSALVTELFDAYLDQVLVDGFFHADPHPGNILLTEDGRLALIDLGMVGRVPDRMQDSLLRLLLAIAEGRGDRAAEILSALGEPQPSFDSTAFTSACVDLLDRHATSRLEDIQAGRVVGELARISAASGLRPPREMTMVSKTLLNLDEVTRLLAPTFQPSTEIRDHLRSIMQRKMAAAASPGNLLTAALDAKEFAENLPSRVNKVMDALAEGELTLNVQGIDDAQLMRGIQKVANRVAAGMVLAALLLAAALFSRVRTHSTIFGYPTLSVVLLAVACVMGVCLLVSVRRHDLPQEPDRTRR
jgi:ubiquinone biosynthesis protein